MKSLFSPLLTERATRFCAIPALALFAAGSLFWALFGPGIILALGAFWSLARGMLVFLAENLCALITFGEDAWLFFSGNRQAFLIRANRAKQWEHGLYDHGDEPEGPADIFFDAIFFVLLAPFFSVAFAWEKSAEFTQKHFRSLILFSSERLGALSAEAHDSLMARQALRIRPLFLRRALLSGQRFWLDAAFLCAPWARLSDFEKSLCARGVQSERWAPDLRLLFCQQGDFPDLEALFLSACADSFTDGAMALFSRDKQTLCSALDENGSNPPLISAQALCFCPETILALAQAGFSLIEENPDGACALSALESRKDDFFFLDEREREALRLIRLLGEEERQAQAFSLVCAWGLGERAKARASGPRL